MSNESTRQKIIKLLNENHPIDQIVKTLKVTKGYIYSVKSSLKHPSSQKGKLKKRLEEEGVQSTQAIGTVRMVCKYCKNVYIININPGNKELYTKELIANYICLQWSCQSKKRLYDKLGK